jgi:hypothetical protein
MRYPNPCALAIKCLAGLIKTILPAISPPLNMDKLDTLYCEYYHYVSVCQGNEKTLKVFAECTFRVF